MNFLRKHLSTREHVGSPVIKDPEVASHILPVGSGRLGFLLQWSVTAAEPYDDGTYTVTAP